MAHLSPSVRNKAVEIANALLHEGHDEGQAIRIGIAKARQWAELHACDSGRFGSSSPT